MIGVGEDAAVPGDHRQRLRENLQIADPARGVDDQKAAHRGTVHRAGALGGLLGRGAFEQGPARDRRRLPVPSRLRPERIGEHGHALLVHPHAPELARHRVHQDRRASGRPEQQDGHPVAIGGDQVPVLRAQRTARGAGVARHRQGGAPLRHEAAPRPHLQGHGPRQRDLGPVRQAPQLLRPCRAAEGFDSRQLLHRPGERLLGIQPTLPRRDRQAFLELPVDGLAQTCPVASSHVIGRAANLEEGKVVHGHLRGGPRRRYANARTTATRMAAASSTWRSSIHSSALCAWRMDPGPNTTAGIPARASLLASVP